MTDIMGRTAFITGGANGIGLGIARAFAQSGVKLGLADMDKSALELAKVELAAMTEVETFHLDVRDRNAFIEAVDAVESRLGPISLLINNAGVAGSGGIAELSYNDWEWSIGINLWGVINGIQTVLPRMIERKVGGHVVNTASASGLVGGTATIPYCTAKFGVVGLSESLRPELMSMGIGVSVLCPGPVATGILNNSARTRDDGTSQSEGLPGANMSNLLHNGVAPDAVGYMVADAISRDQFYIHTDRVILAALEDRHNEIVAAIPDAQMNDFSVAISRALSERRKPSM